jgi:hypothetical protein
MPIIQASGTQAASVGVEQTLADLTSPFVVFQLLVDVSNMQAGDVTELRIYTKVLAGGGLDSAIYQQLSGAPTGNGDQVMMSLPVVSDQEIKFTLKQIAGSARNYPWKVVSF